MEPSRTNENHAHIQAQVLTTAVGAPFPKELCEPITRFLANEISGEIALMHLVLQLGGTGRLTSTLETLAATSSEEPKLRELLHLAATNADTLAQVTRLVETGFADIPTPGGDAIAATRARFDRAVAAAPEASVALYSLGSAAILDRATTEIVGRLAEWELIGPDRVVLDVGCGIGRIEKALAPYVATITGIDLSRGMIAEAKRRCRDLPNVAFRLCQGRDLGAFEDQSADLVLAVDSFPYLVATDPAIAERHVRDAARLLRPRGTLLILNFSYRGDIESDRRDMARLAVQNGFVAQRLGTRDFTLWDGTTFQLTK